VSLKEEGLAKNQITAVDVGTNSVKVLQLALTQTGIMIVNSGVESYQRQSASERISDGVIIDTLSQLISGRGIKTKPVVLALPRHSVTVKSLVGLPTSATDEDIEKMVPIQVAPELPFPIADAVYSGYNLQRSPEGISLEVVAAKRASVERYVDIAEKAGLKLKAIIPSSFATYGLIFDQLKGELAGRTIAVAEIGAGMTDICIIQHGRLAFSRSFNFGGNDLTEAFEKEYKLSFQMAEERKISSADLQSAGGDALAHQWAENLAIQIDRSLRAFTSEGAINGINSLWLCGGSSNVSGLDNYLANRLGIAVSLYNPMKGIEEQPLGEGVAAFGRGLSVPLGLGIVGIAGEKRTSTVNANLLPKEIKQREERVRQKVTAFVATVLAVLVLAGASLGFIGWHRSRKAAYQKVANELRVLERKEETHKATAALENSILMQRMVIPYVTPLEVLREMSERLPERTKIALTSLTVDKKGKVTMSVEAASHADLSKMIQILNEMELSDEVGIFDEVKYGAISSVKKQNRSVLQVQIACSLNKDAMQEVK
jgi:type IV pilus assembly protein PilM